MKQKCNSQYAFKSYNSYKYRLIKSQTKIKLQSTSKRNKTTNDKITVFTERYKIGIYNGQHWKILE